MRKKWLLVLIGVLAVGIAYLGYSLFAHTQEDFLSVSAFKSQAQYDRQVNLGGKVVPGSTKWDEQTRQLRFNLSDNKESLTVVYQGVVPDDFKVGAEVIVTGKYGKDAFEATGFISRRSLCKLCHS